VKTVLAIDPGTHCGWALQLGAGATFSGSWDLKPSRFEGGGMRWLRLRRCLDDATRNVQVDVVAFEEVRRHMGVDAAHVYGGIVAVVQAWCEEHSVPYMAIPVGTVKKRATGKGNADKRAMLDAARARFTDQHIVDDNQADALWILSAARVELGEVAA
jgi:crossover junction endodeoxyribonuclease RuvC